MARSNQERPGAYRKGARKLGPPSKPRKRSAKKKTKRVKTGAYAGQLIASKPVKMTKRCIRIRERYAADNGFISDARRVWTGANTIGDEKYLFSLISEAMLLHILSRINDTRSDKDATTNAGFLDRIEMKMVRPEMQNSSGTLERSFEYHITPASNSFNSIVYNDNQALSPNLTYIDGAAAAPRQGLPQTLYDFARQGYYPSKLFLYRTDTATTPNRHEILRDTQFGKANIKISIVGTHKFQNVTPADDQGSARFNANAIDANPISGKIFTFRNLAPTFNNGWMTAQGTSAVAVLDGFAGRPTDTTNWDYKQISSVTDSSVGVGLPVLDEFKLPPLRPRTIFSNVKTSNNVSIPPGGFKIFKTKFTYDGSIFKLIRDVTQITLESSIFPSPAVGKYPSLGSSFLLCLSPTMKTGPGEDPVTVGFDFTKDGQAYMTKYSAGVMPTTNIVA